MAAQRFRMVVVAAALIGMSLGACTGAETARTNAVPSPGPSSPLPKLPSVEGWATLPDRAPCAGCEPVPARIGPAVDRTSLIVCLVDGTWSECGVSTYDNVGLAGPGVSAAALYGPPETVLPWPSDADPTTDPSRQGPRTPWGSYQVICTSASGADYQCGASGP